MRQFHYEKIDESIGKDVRTTLSDLWPEIHGGGLTQRQEEDILEKNANKIVRVYDKANGLGDVSYSLQSSASGLLSSLVILHDSWYRFADPHMAARRRNFS